MTSSGRRHCHTRTHSYNMVDDRAAGRKIAAAHNAHNGLGAKIGARHCGTRGWESIWAERSFWRYARIGVAVTAADGADDIARPGAATKRQTRKPQMKRRFGEGRTYFG